VSAAPWPHGDPNVVIRAILAQKAFEGSQATPIPESPLARFVDYLLRAIGDAMHRIFPHAVPAATSRAAASSVVFIAAVIAIAYLGYRVLRIVDARRARRVSLPSAAAQAAATATRHSLLQDAAAAAGAGDYARAIALLFRAALLDLDGGALVPFDPARTPGEYRRLVRRAAATASAPFDDLAARFIRATFGAQPPQATDYDRAREAYSAFAAAAGAA
jgi:hypothetical protein